LDEDGTYAAGGFVAATSSDPCRPLPIAFEYENDSRKCSTEGSAAAFKWDRAVWETRKYLTAFKSSWWFCDRRGLAGNVNSDSWNQAQPLPWIAFWVD